MCLYTYVIELPGVKEENVEIRVSEGRFLIIEAHGCKETVSPLHVELERLRKRAREMMEQNQRMHRERMEEKQRKHREEMEEIERRVQEQEERIEHLKEMGEKRKKLREELEELQRMSQQEASYHVALVFQRACGSNNTYHQSPAAVHTAGMNYTLPQFNFRVPLSSFPPAAPIPFGHRRFAGSANLHGNFSVNPSTTPASLTTGYDDVINSASGIRVSSIVNFNRVSSSNNIMEILGTPISTILRLGSHKNTSSNKPKMLVPQGQLSRKSHQNCRSFFWVQPPPQE
ncbi:hypothetical protein MKW98_031048 [Papaver atlanticum]|uniref:SHSP domain-containing protein n=1 Tax=Papaver atlanticum TaxID=357466 RepID=A0AAD4SXV2_9MAGN|nr:hypothetical protein MKW98_031048 [Papaver atlanticum]